MMPDQSNQHPDDGQLRRAVQKVMRDLQQEPVIPIAEPTQPNGEDSPEAQAEAERLDRYIRGVVQQKRPKRHVPERVISITHFDVVWLRSCGIKH